MDAGKLDRRCTFQKETRVSDGGGGYATTWAVQETRWGGLLTPTLRGQMEQIAAGAVTTVIAGVITVRDDSFTRQITRDWRVVTVEDATVSPALTQTWNIRKVYPRERDGYIRMEVEAGVPT